MQTLQQMSQLSECQAQAPGAETLRALSLETSNPRPRGWIPATICLLLSLWAAPPAPGPDSSAALP